MSDVGHIADVDFAGLELEKNKGNEIEGLAIQRLPIILLWCENEWSSIARWIAT